MDETTLVASIVAVVATFRKAYPKLDGISVPFFTILVAIVFVFAYSPDAAITVAATVAILKHGVRLGLTGVGGVFAIGYGAQKIGEGYAAVTAKAVHLGGVLETTDPAAPLPPVAAAPSDATVTPVAVAKAVAK